MEQPGHMFSNQIDVKFETIMQWMEENVQDTLHNGLPREAMLSKNAQQTTHEKKEKISTNRLGGQYSTGRPLPMEIREKIVKLSKDGLKPCQISKELRVSHGCVSKLLAKWRKTGTVKPEKIGGSRPKKVLPLVAKAITAYKHYRPRLQSWQIKECLIKDGICHDGNVPSVSSINKTLRNQRRVKSSSSPSSEFDDFSETKSASVVGNFEDDFDCFKYPNLTKQLNCDQQQSDREDDCNTPKPELVTVKTDPTPLPVVVITNYQPLSVANQHPLTTIAGHMTNPVHMTASVNHVTNSGHAATGGHVIYLRQQYQPLNVGGATFEGQPQIHESAHATDLQPQQHFEYDPFEFFVSPASSTDSAYGGSSFNETSLPDIGHLSMFFDDVFT